MVKRSDGSRGRTKDLVTHVLGREVASMNENDPRVRAGFDAEGVHQLRVSARRLRSELRAMRDVLPRRPWRPLSNDLHWIGATLGGLRDLDVLEELLESHASPGTGLYDDMSWAFDVRRAHHRRQVNRLLRSSRYARVRRDLAELSRKPGLGALGRTPASELFTPVLWSAACRYLRVIGDPDARRTDAQLHGVRIASKQCRYTFEVGSLVLGEPARLVARHLADTQDVLGQVHDRVVASDFLDHLGRDPDEETRKIHVALRREIDERRLQWSTHYLDARRAMERIFTDLTSFDD